MVDKPMTDSSDSSHPLVDRMLASKPPIAHLIGFEVSEIRDGRAVGVLRSGPQHANPMGTIQVECCATWRIALPEALSEDHRTLPLVSDSRQA